LLIVETSLTSKHHDYAQSQTLLQLGSWVDELRQELQNDEAADTLEATERLLEQCGQQRDSSLDACVSTIARGETLLQELR
jgi:triple functional domain protein